MATSIARMNVRITIQKNIITSDRYRNRVQRWEDWFTCSAYASTYHANENVSETVYEEKGVTFMVRYCPETAVVTSTSYRILFNGENYNILSVDPMNYQHREIHFKCALERLGGTDGNQNHA